jgi:hypothetical protein
MLMRDLVADFWANQRRESAKPVAQQALHWGTAADISADGDGLHPYLKSFLETWNPRLGRGHELSWRMWRDERARVITVVFEAQERGRSHDSREHGGPESWSAVLKRLGVSLRKQRAGMLLSYGMVRAVSDTAIVIAKRDERRMWTASAAREDADATTAQLMALQRGEQPVQA